MKIFRGFAKTRPAASTPKKSLREKLDYAGSIEEASIVRKFTVLFLLMSVIPTTLLYYFYLQIRDYGSLQISASEFHLTLTIVVTGVVVGFFAMRTVLVRVVELADANRKALERVMTPERVKILSREKNEIAVLAQSFAAITDRLEENVRDLRLAKDTLHSVLAKVGQGISSMQNIDTFLELIMETVTEALTAKKSALFLLDDSKRHLILKTSYGVSRLGEKEISISRDFSPEIVALLDDKKAQAFERIHQKSLHDPRVGPLFDQPMIGTPLLMRGKVKGALIVCGHKMSTSFNEDDCGVLFNLGIQTMIAIQNSKLNEDIESTYFETISALALAVDAKDKYSRGHLDRVAKYATTIGTRLGLDEDDLKTLRDAARLHDLGKLGIPDEVLKKEGPLTDQEWLLMKKHPEIGESIIRPVRSLEHLCDIIRHHHEKLDGTGYPDRLKDSEISPLVRILTISDIYDALTTDRSYRPRMKISEACKELRDMKGQLDQDIVEIFIEAVEHGDLEQE